MKLLREEEKINTRLQEILSHLLVCLAAETQINLLWKALSPRHQLPRKPDGWMLGVGGGTARVDWTSRHD